MGSRLLPATKDIPKEMLPIAGTPMVQLCVEEAVAAGIGDVCIVLNPRKTIIRDYFCNWSRGVKVAHRSLKRVRSLLDKCKLIFEWQREPCGIADAIDCARDFVAGEPFALLLPDNVIFARRSALSQMKETFNRYGKDTNAVVRIPSRFASTFSLSGKIDYEIVRGRALSITRFYRKRKGYYPAMKKPLIRVVARSIFFPHFFEYIDRVSGRIKREFDDGPVLREIVRREGLMGHMIEGVVFDAGNPRGYAAANSWAVSHFRIN